MTTPTFTDEQLADGKREYDRGYTGSAWGIVCPGRRRWGVAGGQVGCGICETCLAFSCAIKEKQEK